MDKIKQFFSWLFTTVAETAVGVIVIAAVAAFGAALTVWEKNTQISLPTALLGGAVGFASILASWAAIQQIDARAEVGSEGV